MAGRVPVRPAEGVAGLGQNLVAGIHDQCGKGMFAARLRGGGERDGVAYILQVTLSGGSFHPDIPPSHGMHSPLFEEQANGLRGLPINRTSRRSARKLILARYVSQERTGQ